MQSARTPSILIVLVLLGLSLVLPGCYGSHQGVTEAASKGWEEQGFGSADDVRVTDEVPIDTAKTDDSHTIMAAMILKGAGKEADLSTYNDVMLVTFDTEDGREVTAVLLNHEEMVIPESARQ